MLIRVYSIADGTLSIEEFRDLSEVTEQTLDRGCWVDIEGFGETDLSNAGERLQLDPLWNVTTRDCFSIREISSTE